MKKIIVKNVMPLVALGITFASLVFMSFKNESNEISEDPNSKLESVILHFDGNANSASEVENESNWSEDNPGSTCSGTQKACSMTVQDTDVQGPAGSRTLDPAKITLQAVGNPTDGYRPQKSGGTGSTPSIQNRN